MRQANAGRSPDCPATCIDSRAPVDVLPAGHAGLIPSGFEGLQPPRFPFKYFFLRWG
jgi:hypothetical protein